MEWANLWPTARYASLVLLSNDNNVSIREGAVDALHAALALISERENRLRPQMLIFILLDSVDACTQTHPKYLHSNSTSHVWAFGAIAELVGASCSPKISSCSAKSHLFHFEDNALDAGASKFHIDLLTTSQLFSIKPEPGTFNDPSFYTTSPPDGH
jgi:hypothetical protein